MREKDIAILHPALLLPEFANVGYPPPPPLPSPQLTCAGRLCTTPEPSISTRPHATLGSTGLVVAVITGEDKLFCVEEAAALSLGIGRGARVSTVHCVCVKGEKEGGGGRGESGGWREEGGGGRMEGGRELYEAYKLKGILLIQSRQM